MAPDGQSFVKPGGKKVPYLMRAISVSYLKYRATESTIPIAQYWCADSRAAVGDASLGWAKIHSGEFESVRVPGSHWTLFNEPHVATLADRLARSLRRAREEP